MSSHMTDEDLVSPCDKPKVLVLGFGALGTLYGFLLSRGGAQVYAVARSNVASLRERGVNIRSDKYGNHDAYKPAGVLSSPEEARAAGPFDYVLCTVKIVPEERAVGQWIRQFLVPSSEGTSGRWKLPAVIFVENGIGIEIEPHASLVDHAEPVACTIASCCAWLGATLIDGGRSVTHGTFEVLEMGLYPPPVSASSTSNNGQDDTKRLAKLRGFHHVYTKGQGGGVLVEGDIQPKRWTKLLWNAAWGGITALARQPVLVMLQDENLEYTSHVVRKTMLEILHVARACGYNEDVLPASEIDKVFNLTYSQAPSIRPKDQPANLTTDFKPSILMDLEAGRPFELSPIIKNVVQKARQHNIDTPRLDVILAALHPSLIASIGHGKQTTSNGQLSAT